MIQLSSTSSSRSVGPAESTSQSQQDKELIQDIDQAWDHLSDQEEEQPIITTQTTTPPPVKQPPPLEPLQTTTTHYQQPELTTNSQDILNLIKDPAYILSRLKADQDLQEQNSPAQTPFNSTRTSLPWEAVIPAELITKKNSDFGGEPSSRTPSPEGIKNQSSAGSYTRLPETPLQTKPANQTIIRELKFINCLSSPTLDVAELRKLAWAGIPTRLRALVWMILLGYLPAPISRRLEVLARKRREYLDALRLAFASGTHKLDQTIWHQIQIDVARTHPGVPLWQFHATQRSLERILYVWAIRHPASGYVQGINDLVTPFFQVFLTAYIDGQEAESFDVGLLPPEALDAIEADSFWSLSKLLEGIQDNYIFAQPGIQRQVARMKELCERVDARLHKHLEDEKVEFIQFAFRWINCLLMRELSTKKIIRMWDTYLAEGTAAFSEFHLYVCLAFLVRYSDQLRAMDFQSIIIFLQALPTDQLTEKDLEFILSQAFMWHSLFQGATGHFVRK